MITQKPPNYPFVTINSTDSTIGNHGIAALQEDGGYCKRQWTKGYSIHIGTATNNIKEIWEVRHGLNLAWELDFKYINLDIESELVIN